MGVIYSIVIKPEDVEDERDRREFLRVPLQSARLVAGYGIEGDAKGSRHSGRHINVLSREWLDELKPLGYRTEPGDFGEQIVLQGISIESLASGAQLQLGDAAVIELTRPRTGCDRLEAAQGRSNEAFGGTVGTMARVVRDGPIRVGDRVSVLDPIPD